MCISEELIQTLISLFFLTDPVRAPMAVIYFTTVFFWMSRPVVRYICISHSKHRHDFNVLRFLPESLWERQTQVRLFTEVFQG